MERLCEVGTGLNAYSLIEEDTYVRFIVHTTTAKDLTIVIFHRSNTEITGSNPASGMDVYISHKVSEKFYSRILTGRGA
jgi:hypothetical protein